MYYKHKADKLVLEKEKKGKKQQSKINKKIPFSKFQGRLNFMQAQLLLGKDPEVKPNHSNILNDDSSKDTVMS